MSAERTLQLLDDRFALRLRSIDLRSLIDALQTSGEDLTTQGLRQLYDRELALIECQLRNVSDELRLLGLDLGGTESTLH